MRLRDAHILLAQRRYGAAAYFGGYAAEMMLKARICRTLKWAGFPETRKEFEGYSSFRTHDLEVLLRLSGQEPRVAATLSLEWSLVAKWSPELRYSTTVPSKAHTRELIQAIEALLRIL